MEEKVQLKTTIRK